MPTAISSHPAATYRRSLATIRGSETNPWQQRKRPVSSKHQPDPTHPVNLKPHSENMFPDSCILCGRFATYFHQRDQWANNERDAATRVVATLLVVRVKG